MENVKEKSTTKCSVEMGFIQGSESLVSHAYISVYMSVGLATSSDPEVRTDIFIKKYLATQTHSLPKSKQIGICC